MKVIISGGGSGGHVFPAIAIANELRRRDQSTEILFVGAKDKLEMEKVPLEGYEIQGLWISGWHRKEIVRNLLFPIKLLFSLIKARRIIVKYKPDVVVGVGGFASGPVLEMASRRNVPTLIQEQNSFPGKTNLLLAKKVDRICVAYDNMNRFFPEDKIVITGNPIRTNLKRDNPNISEALNYFDLDKDKMTVFVMGGSLGAKSINEAVALCLENKKLKQSVQLLWQIGKLYWPIYSGKYQRDDVKMYPFIDKMDLAYEAADIVVCRSGAMTIAELCYLGKAAILIPSPNVAEDHQTKNARAIEGHQATEVIMDSELNAQLSDRINDLINDSERLKLYRNNIKKLAQPRAIHKIADEIIKLVA